MNWQFELYTLSQTLEEYYKEQHRLEGCMCFGFVIIGVIIAVIFIKGKSKPSTLDGGNNAPQIKSQYKIDRYINAFRNNKGTNEINEAAEDLIDEYLYYYSKNRSADDMKECAAIMKALDDYPYCYSGRRPYPRDTLCDDIIRMLRDKQ